VPPVAVEPDRALRGGDQGLLAQGQHQLLAEVEPPALVLKLRA
jgi:hypothetical protein